MSPSGQPIALKSPSNSFVAEKETKTLAEPPAYDAEVQVQTHDAEEDVFGNAVGEGGVEYKTMNWMQAAVLLIKSQVGLGVLSLPSAMHTLGAVPATIIILVLGLMSAYGVYELGQFRRNHPSVHSVGDVGYILAGRPGREFLGWAYWLLQTFTAASAFLSVSISLNAVSSHGSCTIVFTVVAAIAASLVATMRTFRSISWFGWVGLVSIVTATLIVTIAVGVSDRPPTAPAGPFDKELRAFNNPSFAEAFLAIVNILFAYAGTPSFLGVIAEMRNPQDFNKSVGVLASFEMSFYLSIGIVVYYYCGQYVASPALGSAGPLLKKVSYGIAIPALLFSAIIFTHYSAKYLFVRVLRGSRHLQSETFVHWSVWLTCVFGCGAFSFIIAEVIPFFNSLLGLVGALFASIFSIGLLGVMWLFDNYHRLHLRCSIKLMLMAILNVLMVAFGLVLLGAGTYASAISIRDEFNKGTVGSPFSCADNSK